MRKLEGKCCPGEAVCTSNRKDGEIAGVRGRSQGYTLQNHCHNEEVTPFNGLKEPCPFFDTKPENIPHRIIGAVQTAEEYRELKELGLLKNDLGSLTAFEYECYRTAEAASRLVESEAIKDARSGNGGEEKIGNAPPEESAFGNWEK